MMKNKLLKILSILLCFLLVFQQSGFAQVAAQLDIAGHLANLRNAFAPDIFRPLHLRYLSYDYLNNNFKLLLDKGSLANPQTQELENATKELLNYFFVGVTLPNDTFWVNLRPDSPNDIIDPLLAQTDVGRILLEADLQLKKDTARFTSPETPEGKGYWNKLYQKAEELFGSQNVTIPTLTRPWIVPDEIIIRESTDSAYVYKATLKVMLEQDYLKGNATYSFKDERLKELNEYSSSLIREKIIPKLTKRINTSKDYAPLRQVYYSLILSQWFKARNQNKNTQYSRLIDRKDLSNLTSKTPYLVDTYFNAYKENFEKGEYNIQEPTYTPYGQVIRSYFSGGITNIAPVIPQRGAPTTVDSKIGTSVTVTQTPTNFFSRTLNKFLVLILVFGAINTANPAEVTVRIQEKTPTEVTVVSEKPEDVRFGTHKFLFHTHLGEPAQPIVDALEDTEVSLAKNFILSFEQFQRKHGAIVGKRKFMEDERSFRFSPLGTGFSTEQELDDAYKKAKDMLFRYRMYVREELLMKHGGQIKKYREEVEVIKRVVREYKIKWIGVETTPGNLRNRKSLAGDTRKSIIQNLETSEFPNYSQVGDDLFLLLEGPGIYLYATGYSPLINGEVELMALESPELNSEGKKIVESLKGAKTRLFSKRSDIVDQWNKFEIVIKQPDGRLLSYYEIDKRLNELFKNNKTGREEAETAVNLSLEFYRNSDQRDEYLMEQLAGRNNVLVIRGQEHRPTIERLIKQMHPRSSDEMKPLGLRDPLDEDANSGHLSNRHVEFENMARSKSTESVYGLTAQVVTADLDNIGAYHFYSDKLGLIIVVNSRYNSQIQEEGKFHEVREIYWMGKGFNQHEAHVIASAEQIQRFSQGELTPYHRSQLEDMTAEEKEFLSQEDRSWHHSVLERANALGASIDIDKIKRYEAGLRSAVNSSPQTDQQPGEGGQLSTFSIRERGFPNLATAVGEGKVMAQVAERVMRFAEQFPPELRKLFDVVVYVKSRAEYEVEFEAQHGRKPGKYDDLEYGHVEYTSGPDGSRILYLFVGEEALTKEDKPIPPPSEKHLTFYDNATFERILLHELVHYYTDVFWGQKWLRKIQVEGFQLFSILERIAKERARDKIDETFSLGKLLRRLSELHNQPLDVANFTRTREGVQSAKLIIAGLPGLNEAMREIGMNPNDGAAFLRASNAILYQAGTLASVPGSVVLSDAISEWLANAAVSDMVVASEILADIVSVFERKQVQLPAERQPPAIGAPTIEKSERNDDDKKGSGGGTASSGVVPWEAPKTTGGIDFRYLPIVTQAMDNLKASIGNMPLNNLKNFNLSHEWSEIERLINSGITPSAERLKDYLTASCIKDKLAEDIDKIISCISDILRLEEERCYATEPMLKDILVVLESASSSQQLKEVFTGSAS